MNKLLQVALATFLFLQVSNALGQYAVGDLNLDGDIAAWYDQSVGYKNVPVLEGSFYPLPYIASKQSPYLESNKWSEGQLTFAGEQYNGLYLLYNTYHDLLIIRNRAVQISAIEPTLLNQHKVDEFVIHGHQFIHLKDSVAPGHAPGFYELFFDGQSIDFYIKRIKNEYIKGREIVFQDEDRYFLFDGQQFIKYKGKKSMYKCFPEIKAQMKSYSKSLYMNLKKNQEEGMLTWLAYGDQLLTEK
ncbi:hypothetical protein SAMN04488029_0618 [Reichenbachiella faecimaris]|uniref:DKNYY family protein n=1 Tax=Reichenbachiella faecimaris TaxID=692418 RepID=A0A1W2G6I5_REIFA|nr:hypothetical protein [Reichenbachiella faecimaris]SMD32275.1 hypothetical protein SAMN04488029_0618 [Reichenbachiella faecimaris]